MSTFNCFTSQNYSVYRVVEDVFEGENAFGAVLTAPLILADTIEKTDYQTAFAPAKKTIDLKEQQNQHGYKLTVQKIELADEETRVYVKVTNDTSDKISFYSFNTRIIVNGQQLEEQYNYEAEYPEFQSDILPGVSSEGIITFPHSLKMHPNFSFTLKGHLTNGS